MGMPETLNDFASVCGGVSVWVKPDNTMITSSGQPVLMGWNVTVLWKGKDGYTVSKNKSIALDVNIHNTIDELCQEAMEQVTTCPTCKQALNG